MDQTEKSLTATPAKKAKASHWPIWGLYAITLMAHLPLIRSMAIAANAHAQLTQSILILTTVIALLFFKKPKESKSQFQFSNECILLLAISYGLTLLGILTHWGMIVLASTSVGLGSFLIYCFGSKQRRIVYTVVTAFFIYANFVYLMPLFDWPLRLIAGDLSKLLLFAIGQSPELRLVEDSNQWMLLLFNNGRPFYVAPECNGYGIITASILTSICLLVYRKFTLIKSAIILLSIIALAFIANAIRIVIIVLLAPIVGMQHYDLMHEIVGLALLLGTLSLIWLTLAERRF